MFEKEAEEFSAGKAHEHYNYLFEEHAGSPADFARFCFQNGAEFGYNKANEWHFIKDGDLPKVKTWVIGFYYGKGNWHKLFYRADGNWWGEGQLCQPPYAWKEIVLPKEIFAGIIKDAKEEW